MFLGIMINVLLGISIILLVYLCWTKRNLYFYSRNVPSPKGWSIIRVALDIVGSTDQAVESFKSYFGECTGICKVWLGPNLIYGVGKPEYVQKILTSREALSKMYLYNVLAPVIGQSLLTAPVPIWKYHRKIIASAFNQKCLDYFVQIFNQHTKVTIKILEKNVGQGEFDLYDKISLCTGDIIFETALGAKIDAQTTDSKIYKWMNRYTEILALKLWVFWYHFDFIFHRTQLFKEVSLLMGKINDITNNIIHSRKLELQKEPMKIESTTSVLDRLLLSTSNGTSELTLTEIMDETKFIVAAGTDGTAATLSLCFLMLAMNEEIQERVHEEVIDALGPDNDVETTNLSLLGYTERVIKETLRLFPAGPLIGRDIDSDLVLEDDLILPKGSSVFIPIIDLHRNADVWPDPLKFDPDRFSPAETAKRHPYSFIPFSAGLRNCLGYQYAMIMMKTFLALTIRKYKFSASHSNIEDIKLKFNLTLKIINGCKVSVEHR